MPPAKKIAIVSSQCVACGTCVKSCPKHAISIYRGVIAVVSPQQCVGCGKCSKTCPAGVIKMKERETIEKAMV